jgi:hypothetical protein
MKIDGPAPIEHGEIERPERKDEVYRKMGGGGMRESEDDLRSHRIGLVPCLVDRKSRCAQQTEEWLRIVALRENQKVHIVGGTWSPPDTEG